MHITAEIAGQYIIVHSSTAINLFDKKSCDAVQN